MYFLIIRKTLMNHHKTYKLIVRLKKKKQGGLQGFGRDHDKMISDYIIKNVKKNLPIELMCKFFRIV